MDQWEKTLRTEFFRTPEPRLVTSDEDEATKQVIVIERILLEGDQETFEMIERYRP